MQIVKEAHFHNKNQKLPHIWLFKQMNEKNMSYVRLFFTP